MYDPSLGKWHCQDPLQQFHSPYLYTGNNPLRFFDPSGMYSTEEWKKDNGFTHEDFYTVYESDDGDEAEDNPPEEASTGMDFSKSFLKNFADIIGKAFQDMFFEDEELSVGGKVKTVRDDVEHVANAVAQGPVAIVVSGNLAAQMYTGGIDVSGGVIIILKGDDKGTYAIADGGVPFTSSGFSAGQLFR
jgi:hypothetical protein